MVFHFCWQRPPLGRQLEEKKVSYGAATQVVHMGLKLIVWSHVVTQFALRDRGVASASAAVVKCMQSARNWVQLQFTRQKRREIFCHFEGKVITWLMLDWGLPRKNW